MKQLIGDDFLVRRLGLIQLKGKTEATVVYEVLAEKNDLTQSRMSIGGVDLYEEAFHHFLSRRFAEAEKAGFLKCEEDYPGRLLRDPESTSRPAANSWPARRRRNGDGPHT